jgi:hypothetical protein
MSRHTVCELWRLLFQCKGADEKNRLMHTWNKSQQGMITRKQFLQTIGYRCQAVYMTS